MKKIFVLAVMSISMFYYGYAQGVYNGDFEAWENKVFYEDPLGFTTANAQLFVMGGTPNVSKSLDATDGMYSLKMETTTFMGDTIFGYAVFGKPNDDFFFGGFPYTEMPDSIKGSFKYNLSNNDSAVILILFKKNGLPIGMEFIPIYGQENTWTEKAFKLMPLGQAPDSVIIGFASSTPDGDFVNPGNMLMVDNISFTNATTPIPNHSFEDWNTMQAQEPLGWNTFNLYFLLDGKQASVTKSSDAYMGNSAISVKTSTLSFFGGDLDTFGIATTGMIGNFGFAGGFALNNKPDSLSFYYKYNNAHNPMDLAIVYAAFSKFNTGLQHSVTIDSSMAFLPGAFNWTRRTLTFNPVSGIPDTSNIILLSSNLFFGTNMGVGNELIVDEMIYWYGTVGIPVIADDIQTNFAYPNPASETVNIDISLNEVSVKELNISIFDLKGNLLSERKVIVNTNGKQTISNDVSFLAKGAYIITISDGGSNAFNTKFVKE